MPVVPPPFLALAAGIAQHAIAPERRPNLVRTIAASAVASGSLVLMGASVDRFRRAGTTVEPFHPERANALVTIGPYSITRNPMYVGMTGMLVAHAAYRGGIATLLPAAGFVAVIDRLQIRPEEKALVERFGDEYVAYRDHVPRWLR